MPARACKSEAEANGVFGGLHATGEAPDRLRLLGQGTWGHTLPNIERTLPACLYC